MFQVGDKLPSVDLYENNPTNKVNLSEISAGKKFIIFAVPGAFTPGCSKVRYFKIILFLFKFCHHESFQNYLPFNNTLPCIIKTVIFKFHYIILKLDNFFFLRLTCLAMLKKQPN